MKTLSLLFFIVLSLLPASLTAQEVTSLAEVTANGGVTLDADGNIYVAHFGPLPIVGGQEGRNIYKVTPTGEVSLFVDGDLNVGSGNNFDSQGFLYQSNYLGNKIIKFDSSGNIVDDNFATINGPVGITVIENDTLVVCECNANSVKKIAQDGSISSFVAGNSFSCANGITQDGNGNFYTTNFSDGRITKISPEGNLSTLGSTPAGNGHLTYRVADQHFYIASYSSNRIYKMSDTGEVSLFAGTGAAGALNATDPLLATFNKPNGIEISKDGCSLYITQDNDVLREIKFEDSNCVLRVDPPENETGLNIYPNPTNGIVKIKNYTTVEIQSLSLINSWGQELKQFDNVQLLDLSEYPSGIFFLRLHSADQVVYIKKVVLEK